MNSRLRLDTQLFATGPVSIIEDREYTNTNGIIDSVKLTAKINLTLDNITFVSIKVYDANDNDVTNQWTIADDYKSASRTYTSNDSAEYTIYFYQQVYPILRFSNTMKPITEIGNVYRDETILDKLKINYLTTAQYEAAKASNLLNENELYCTPD